MKDTAFSVLVSVPPETEELLTFHAELATELERMAENFEVIYLLEPPARSEVSEQAHALYEADPGRVRVFHFAQPGDRAGMLAAGVERARGDLLFTLPGRFVCDFAVLRELRAALEDGADLAFASRTRGKVGGAARLQSELFNRVVSLASARRFNDVASETRALRRSVAEETPLYGDFHRYLPLLAERLGFRVEEIPARQHPDAHPQAVHSPLLYLWRAIDVLSIFFISRFTRHPLRLFGGVGASFAALGGAILAVVGVQRLLGTPLGDRPVLVLGTLLVGLGVQAFTIGLLGELILFFHARNLRDYRITAVYESSPPPLEP